MQPFVHLHVHSQFSVLDGQASIPKLVDKAIADGMPGIALTDHGNMYGIKEFFNYVNGKNAATRDAIKELKAKLAEAPDEERAGIEAEIAEAERKLFKPIFGCEMYVAQGDMTTHIDKHDTGRHLIVLAKNEKGYHNLIKVVSMAWTDGFYMHPRIDKEHLKEHHEGLIICSACLGGEIPRLIMSDQIDEAKRAALWYKEIWGDDYYLELQRHKATVERANHETYLRQMEVNKVLIEMARELDIKLVCTNDVHFVDEDDAEAHDRLICLATNKSLDDPTRMLYSKQEWMKTQAEMNEIFSDVPEALSNTLEVLNKVEFYTIDHKPILPNFPLPEGFTDNDQYLRHLVYKGAHELWGEELDAEHTERLDFELDTIKNMGFPGYFLIVWDFIRAAREMGVSVGPGRGSAAGSAVAYCLGITKIDPIKYDLLFERFLNPDRISLPDIDTDFDDAGRARVFEYVTKKYGAEKVAHIITYGTMAAKSAVKDVARVENLPPSESNRLAKMIPARPNDMPVLPNGKTAAITITNCAKYIPEFGAEYNSSDPAINTVLHYAEKLEGNVRNTGVHACGLIIGRDDITDWVPVSTASDKQGGKMLVTMYEGSVIEDTGLIKMDFLGLKTLTVIDEALANIKLTTGKELDIDNIDINDPKTYKLYCEGRTTGTFQFESAGMQKYLKQLQPSTFEDLIAMNALFRPGPMDYIPKFIARKHGEEPIVYDIPVMERYLKDTYGITVYQEQVMLLSRLLADFTRGESDTLRKAMGKKQIKKMAALKEKFMAGGKHNGYEEKTLEKIWADWEKFASYAFNKSHATCYSWVAFQTAYLKANYPSEFMAGVLSSELNDSDKLSKYMAECRAMGIQVLGPDINESQNKFGVNSRGDIRFGLGGIKSIGSNTVRAIIEERAARGPYRDIFDFVERVNTSSVNRSAIEVLAMAGAFDSFPDMEREDFFAPSGRDATFAETLVKYGQRYQLDKAQSANSLFGADEVMTARPTVPKGERWDRITRLSKEREYIKMFLSGHPLDPYYMEVNFGCNTRISELAEKENEKYVDQELTFGGLVTGFEEKTSKNGNKYGILKIEDYAGSGELRLFGKDFVDYARFGQAGGTAVFVRAKYEASRYDPKRIRLNIISMQLLEEVKGKLITGININMPVASIDKGQIELLQESLNEGKENLGSLFFTVHDDHGHAITLKSPMKMPINRALIDTLNDCELSFKVQA